MATSGSLAKHRRTGEFVVNLVDEATANAMHASSQYLPSTVSEFDTAHVTPIPLRLLRTRACQAPACFECKVWKHLDVSPRHELVIGEVLLVHARDGIIDPQSKRISETLYWPIGRVFADRYCTSRQRFRLPGPLPD